MWFLNNDFDYLKVAVSPTKIFADPEDKGRTILNAINEAQSSIDIGAFSIGSPSFDEALQNALERGVNIRLIGNSQYLSFSSPGFAIQSRRLKNILALLNRLSFHSARSHSRPNNGTLIAKWSSSNFLFSHWKMLLIDTPVEGDIPSHAKALVLTGNPVSYPTHQASQQLEFWENRRDFGVVIEDSSTIEAIRTVFNSDFNGDGRDVTNDLKFSQTGLVWSNGSTGILPQPDSDVRDVSNLYPQDNQYPFFAKDFGQSQGNARDVMAAIIQRAKETKGSLIVYNEEFKDTSIINLLESLGNSGADVSCLYPGINFPKRNMRKLLDANVKIYAGNSNRREGLYIHAKAMVANAGTDQAIGFIGSQNISHSSLDLNRESGVILKGEDTDLIFNTFQNDIKRSDIRPISSGEDVQSSEEKNPDRSFFHPDIKEASNNTTKNPSFFSPGFASDQLIINDT